VSPIINTHLLSPTLYIWCCLRSNIPYVTRHWSYPFLYYLFVHHNIIIPLVKVKLMTSDPTIRIRAVAKNTGSLLTRSLVGLTTALSHVRINQIVTIVMRRLPALVDRQSTIFFFIFEPCVFITTIHIFMHVLHKHILLQRYIKLLHTSYNRYSFIVRLCYSALQPSRHSRNKMDCTTYYRKNLHTIVIIIIIL